MKNELIMPPVVFIIVLAVSLCLILLLSLIRFRSKKDAPKGLGEPYACGEEFADHLIQPDYSQFFPFAFFFTMLHVVALIIATIPTETINTFVMAVVYIVGVIIGLFILLRK